MGREIMRKCRGICIAGGVQSMEWHEGDMSKALLGRALIVSLCRSWACSSPVIILLLLSSLLPGPSLSMISLAPLIYSPHGLFECVEAIGRLRT